MRKLFFILNALVLVQVILSNGIRPDGQGKRLLVLLDNYSTRETHSVFFKSLRERGFQITFKTADEPDLALTKYNEYIFDHLALFCPNVAEFGGNISTKSIVDFIDDGGNVLVAANTELAEPIREIAGECGVEFSDEGTSVIDRFNSDVNDDGQNTLIVSDPQNLINSNLIVGNAKSGAPLLYRGIAMTIDAENPLLMEILTASSYSYTYNPSEKITEYPHSIGKSTLLISALQARNNARLVFAGSLDFFSNDFFASSVQRNAPNSKRFEKSGNQDLATSLSQWVFKEKGVIRASKIDHHKVGENKPPVAYTIKEDIVYSIRIEEMVNGQWVPFQARDVQLEFVRLDPFVRATMTNSNGNFNIKFKIPDVYGIFKFVVDYNRVGYTHLFSSTQVSVRPLEHIQYERFIPAAFPYYASAFSMMLAVFLFSFIQLYHVDEEKKQ